MFECLFVFWGLPQWFSGKACACNAGDLSSITGLGRSLGIGNGNPLQYSCLENSMDRGAWWDTVHGVTNSQTRLIKWSHTHLFSRAAITKYHKLGGLNHRSLFFHNCRGWKFEIRVLVRLVSFQASFLGSQTSVLFQYLWWSSFCTCLCPNVLIKTAVILDQGPP